MKWNETIANTCRYGDVAESIWGDWTIVWENSESDYQGHATFLAEKDGKYAFYEWWYGSCSGCDGWESDGLCSDDIAKEMSDTAMWFESKDALKVWLNMLEGDHDPRSNYSMDRGGGIVAGLDMLSGALLERVNAVRAALDMPPYGEPTDLTE